jgi:transposase
MQEEGAVAAGVEPTDEEIRRFDKKRKNKKVSNEDWESPTDPDARIAKLKDGRTHLAYKAEHTLDLESELILSAEVYAADQSDQHTLVDSVLAAQENLKQATGEASIEEVAADKGYHAAEQLELAQSLSLRTYIPEPQRKHKSRWTGKPPELKDAVYANRRRTQRNKSKRLQRLRSERVERSFAHLCDTGGMRRSWLRGLAEVAKRYRLAAAAHNLAIVMRRLFKIGKPRALQGRGALTAAYEFTIVVVTRCLNRQSPPSPLGDGANFRGVLNSPHKKSLLQRMGMKARRPGGVRNELG